jgi:FkbM family methyltransferase
MRFVARPGMAFSYMLGTTAAAPRYFDRWIDRHQTVFDIGANQGQMTLIFSALVGSTGRVLSFEPSAENYAHLEENLHLNGTINVRALPLAVADFNGSTVFDYSPLRPTQGKLSSVEPTYAVDGSRSVSVKAVTLDAITANGDSPNAIKIDVEGGAAVVLKGARVTIEQFSPVFFIELHGPEEQAGVRDELLARGYVAETVSKQRVSDPTVGWHSPLICYRPK